MILHPIKGYIRMSKSLSIFPEVWFCVNSKLYFTNLQHIVATTVNWKHHQIIYIKVMNLPTQKKI